MKVWITKYALTEGIIVEDGEISKTTPNMIRYGGADSSCKYAHGEGKDWHRTPEEAKARAEQMRLEKIESAKKTLSKLEGMTFAAPNV